MKSTKSGIVASASLVLVSLLIALGASEALLRLKNADMRNYDIEMWRYSQILKRPSDNPVLDREHVPASAATLQSVDVRINTNGLRGAELTTTPQDAPRILFLGSSITLGWGVREEATVSETLGRLIAAKGRSALVLNGGIGNYNAVRYVTRFIDKLSVLKPDIIVVQYFVNDAEALRPNSGNWFLRNSELAVTLWLAIHRLTQAKDHAALLRHYRAVYAPDAPGHRAMVRALRDLADHSRTHGIDVVLAMTPDIHNLADYPLGFIHDRMRSLSAEFGFSYVDLLAAVRGHDARDLWAMPGDPHPNALGHKLMAHALLPELERLLATRSR